MNQVLRRGVGYALALVAAAGCVPPAVTASPTTQAATPTEPAPSPTPVATEVESWTVPETPTPRATPVPYSFSEGGPSPVSAWRPPPYPVPWSLRPEDHFYFSRPIPSGDVNWAHPLYRYGGTYFGVESIHTGIDMGAERNTAVLAAAAGEVIWTGYGLYRGSTDPDDPYGLAVAIRHDFGYEDQTLFTIYAHLTRSFVWLGQRVETGETIGEVGESGHTDGPHLHFEVRLGENGYYSTRNPELWMVPLEGTGVLAGRVTEWNGSLILEQLLQVRSLETGRLWEVWTYGGGVVRPDERFGENFALSDLPAGPYEVQTAHQRVPYSVQFYILPGQTNFLTFRAGRGFTFEPTPAPPDLIHPPIYQ